MEARNLDFEFGIAGASSDMVELLIPHDNREAPYIWWKVPNNDSQYWLGEIPRIRCVSIFQ